MAHHGITGILLAGGASTRFGSPKELAEYEGETLGDRAWRLLGEACDERIRVGPGGVDDPGTGPVAAIEAGLRAASHEIAVVIPVDMPRLTPAALHELAAACRDAAVAQTGPLPCAVARRARPAFESDERRLRTVLARLDTVSITLPEAVLANVNDRDDLQRLG
jgi:molybdenum cofactor guanylyltransferase